VIGLLLLKHIFALSDEEVCERWVLTRTSSTSPVSNSPNRATATALTDGLYPRNRAIFSAACSAVPSRIVDASLTFPIKNDISAMDEIIL
jgi:hypothetical protein